MRKSIIPKFLQALVMGTFVFSSPIRSQEIDVKQVESDLMKKAAENIEKYRKGDVEIVFKL